LSEVAAVLALCRFGQDAAAMLLWGESAYLWALVPRSLASGVTRRLWPWMVAAISVEAVATIAKLPAEVAAIGEGWRDAVDPAMVGSVLRDTSVGQALEAQGAAVVLLVGVAVSRRAYPIGIAGASGLLLAGLSLTGHAAMHEGWLGALQRANDVLHVLSGGAWFGALVPVLVILGDLGHAERRGEAAAALRGFSRAGHVAVALVLSSGVANTALVLGRWPTDWSSPYQVLLTAKIALVTLMVALALVKRYVALPRSARHAGAAPTPLWFGTLAEVPLGLGAIALVSVFGLLDPS